MRTIAEITKLYSPISERIDYPDKGYDVSVYRDENDLYTADIKYPCGELLKGWCDIPTQRNAIYTAVCYIMDLENYQNDHCENEYCRIVK